jgi:hypothetical protein
MGAAAGAAVGAALGAANQMGLIPGQVQLATAIALYMPNNWQEAYGATYNKANFGPILNSFLDAAQSNQKGSGILEGAKAAGASLRSAVPGALSSLGLDIQEGANAVNALSKTVVNTNSEQLFESMEHRTFHFEWTLTPKNRHEAANIARIIDTFKFHMHPELTSYSYLIYPAEFEIEFYSDGDTNKFVSRLSNCALTNMSVNYTPNGQWSALQGTGGYASSVHLTLQFTEIELLTKNRLQQFQEDPTTATYLPVTNQPGTTSNYTQALGSANMGTVATATTQSGTTAVPAPGTSTIVPNIIA